MYKKQLEKFVRNREKGQNFLASSEIGGSNTHFRMRANEMSNLFQTISALAFSSHSCANGKIIVKKLSKKLHKKMFFPIQ